jgi:hypothetical protein
MSWSPRAFRHSHGILRAAFDHWSLAPTMHLATGKPFSDHISGDAPAPPSATGVPCAGCDGFMGAGGQYRLPFLGRDSFRYPDFYNVDLRLARRISFGERRDVEFLAEAFNLLNHRNVTSRIDTMYTVYKSTLEYDSNFNTPTAAASTIYREREVQLGLRLHF